MPTDPLVVVTAFRQANAWLEGLPPLAGGCSETLGASAPSPDGKYVAAVFVRNCGATTPFATHVNLRESSHPFTVTPHGIIEDGELFVRRDKGSVKVVWKAPAHLVIQCPPGQEEIFRQERSWRGVTISYLPIHR